MRRLYGLLDGIAVNACLVQTPQAHRANSVTIEGLQRGEELHPVQAVFVEAALPSAAVALLASS